MGVAGRAGRTPRPVVAIAVAVTVLLLALSGRYGYHRDELYFLTAGHHLAWGYPGQPPFVPLLARLLSDVARGSLVVLRLPSALTAGALVLLTAALTRRLGGDRTAQTVAGGAAAMSALLLGACHLLSTTTFDLLAWALVLLLVLRILAGGDQRLWLAVGVIAGVGLLDSDLVAFLAAGLLVGLLVAGPRHVLASPWLWAGVVIAAALWSPYLVWQARHGWPQLAVSRSIASGGSGTSAPRLLFLPYQFALAGPWFAPGIWVGGLWRLFRDPALRWCRAFGWTYVFLAVVFIAAGGKPYYIGGMFPLLFAAGAQPTVDWVRTRRSRRWQLGAAYAFATPVFLVTLPVVPLAALGPSHLAALDYDMGEQVAWPTYVRQVADVWDRLPAGVRTHAQILTSNYGEAGAVDRYGHVLGLPHAFSGQTGYWYWGPPPASTTRVVAVGFTRAVLQRSFADVRLVRRLDNGLGVDDDEQHAPVWVCSGPRAAWRTLWPRFKHT